MTFIVMHFQLLSVAQMSPSQNLHNWPLQIIFAVEFERRGLLRWLERWASVPKAVHSGSFEICHVLPCQSVTNLHRP